MMILRYHVLIENILATTDKKDRTVINKKTYNKTFLVKTSQAAGSPSF